MLGEPENQFSLSRAALSTYGRAKSKFLSVQICAAILVAVGVQLNLTGCKPTAADSTVEQASPPGARAGTLRIETWVSKTVGPGANGPLPEYTFNPFFIGNPTEQSFRFDRIQFRYSTANPQPEEVTAQTLLWEAGEQIALQHFGGESPAVPAEHKSGKREALTVGGRKKVGLHFLHIMGRRSQDGKDPTLMQVSLYDRDTEILTSDKIPLPSGTKLQEASDLYENGEEKAPGQRGFPLEFWLHPPK